LKVSDKTPKKPDRRRERQERLEAELRANLQKRKALLRARSHQQEEAPPEEAGPTEE
jgi:hypothetical protein